MPSFHPNENNVITYNKVAIVAHRRENVINSYAFINILGKSIQGNGAMPQIFPTIPNLHASDKT